MEVISNALTGQSEKGRSLGSLASKLSLIMVLLVTERFYLKKSGEWFKGNKPVVEL